MKTFTKLFAATALLASASTVTLAQVSAGGALGSSGSVSADAGSTGIGASASGGTNTDASGSTGATSSGVSAGGDINAGASTSTSNSSTAGSAGVSGSADANTSADGNLNASAGASAGAAVDYDAIVSDLRSSANAAAEIDALQGDIQITIVTLSELRSGLGSNFDLDQVVNAQASTKVTVQSAIRADDELSAKIEAALEAEGDFTMEDVVAFSTSAEGQLIVVVDDAE